MFYETEADKMEADLRKMADRVAEFVDTPGYDRLWDLLNDAIGQVQELPVRDGRSA